MGNYEPSPEEGERLARFFSLNGWTREDVSRISSHAGHDTLVAMRHALRGEDTISHLILPKYAKRGDTFNIFAMARLLGAMTDAGFNANDVKQLSYGRVPWYLRELLYGRAELTGKEAWCDTTDLDHFFRTLPRHKRRWLKGCEVHHRSIGTISLKRGRVRNAVTGFVRHNLPMRSHPNIYRRSEMRPWERKRLDISLARYIEEVPLAPVTVWSHLLQHQYLIPHEFHSSRWGTFNRRASFPGTVIVDRKGEWLVFFSNHHTHWWDGGLIDIYRTMYNENDWLPMYPGNGRPEKFKTEFWK